VDGCLEAGEDVEERQATARPQHPSQLGEQPRFVGDVHRHVLGPGHVERRILEREVEGVAPAELDPVGLADAPGEVGGHVDQLLGEVDADHVATEGAGEEPSRTAQPRAHVDHPILGGDAGSLGQRDGGGAPEGVELLGGRQGLGVEVVRVVAGSADGVEHPCLQRAAGVVLLDGTAHEVS